MTPNIPLFHTVRVDMCYLSDSVNKRHMVILILVSNRKSPEWFGHFLIGCPLQVQLPSSGWFSASGALLDCVDISVCPLGLAVPSVLHFRCWQGQSHVSNCRAVFICLCCLSDDLPVPSLCVPSTAHQMTLSLIQLVCDHTFNPCISLQCNAHVHLSKAHS